MRARLGLIWPDVMSLHDRDRAALAVPAMHCRLNLLPKNSPQADVVACLRRGAAQVIEGDPASDLPARLERLIRDVSAPTVAPVVGHRA